MSRFGCAAVVFLIVLCASSVRAEVVIETVTVVNPTNAPDSEIMDDYTTGYGGVSYAYDIGKFEVTAGQYAEFLNAVAEEDPYGLYSLFMFSSKFGCKIRRTGSSGSYSYLVDADEDDVEDADWLNRPVNYVSWGDAARFANWLHNGRPTGAQDPSTTEDGAYHLNGATSDAELMAVARSVNATWVIPSEDEWYKAAYHKNDGVTGNYWYFPTGSNNMPSNELVDPIDPGNNATFYYPDIFTIDRPYYRTEVGAHENSGSPYGTFDQGGNVLEWHETAIASYRGLRGGAFRFYFKDAANLDASYRVGNNPTYENGIIGFRVAQVPGETCDGLDGDGDGDVDLADFAVFQVGFSDGDLAGYAAFPYCSRGIGG